MIVINLKNRLDNLHLTQKKFSELTGIGENSLTRYVNGTFKRIDKTHIEILCIFFNCNVGDLIEYVPDRKE